LRARERYDDAEKERERYKRERVILYDRLGF